MASPRNVDVKKLQRQDRTAECDRGSAKRDKEAVFRLRKGEELDVLSRALGITTVVLSEWRKTFLAGADAWSRSK
ncbi:MAG: hypothetical protein EOO70_06130 [Myxococcaceae bacterium]|nr:MAG: hypothetical protein EOO70_06130 [Myxococcaceae bacterium]